MPDFEILRGLPIVRRWFAQARARLADHEAERVARHFARLLPPRMAIDPAERDDVFALRHGVYCDELGFEPVRDDGRETDAFDDRSLHAYVRHAATGAMAGTVRLVTTHGPDERLPMEVHCSPSLAHATIRPDDFPRESICEISRLAVPARFRRRATDRFAGAANGGIDTRHYSSSELRCFPWIAIALYFSAAALSRRTGRRHVFVMVEPRLAQAMSFVGIDFRQIGPGIEFHGLRAPYYIDRERLPERLSPGFRQLLGVIDDALEDSVAASTPRPC
jgi:N-acyl amino acid synthase of PEP-CTERM/exosortase system